MACHSAFHVVLQSRMRESNSNFLEYSGHHLKHLPTVAELQQTKQTGIYRGSQENLDYSLGCGHLIHLSPFGVGWGGEGGHTAKSNNY